MTINDGSYFDLGTYERPITTSSADAQKWFDRAMVWLYGYNHEEAVACFERALEADPTCAMAHWGIAYAIGPNYNYPWEDFEPDQKTSVLVRVKDHLSKIDRESITNVERDLVNALTTRYPEPGTEGAQRIVETFDTFHDAYADAMRDVYRKHPDDLDVCCLAAESLMTRTPWKLWDLNTGKPAHGADTVEARGILEQVFASSEKAWEHAGLLHMYIHLMEMSSTPEVALRHGDALSVLVPDSGHLLHMATHIDIQCGDYQSVVQRNKAGVAADRKFLQKVGGSNFYSFYRVHNYHFVLYGAMFLAQPKAALEAADELIDTIPLDFMKAMPDYMESFVPAKQHVLVRFGMWREILEQELPQDQELFCFTTAMMRYARTVALANLKDIEAAEAERELFLVARDKVPESRMLPPVNKCRDLLQVAEYMSLGELEYHKGNYDVAFNHLRHAVKLDDDLPYDEPWGWMQPVRHALGALLLSRKRYDEAELVYREDLGLVSTLSRACQHPNNVWSLHGLYECLEHRGETIESIHVKQQLDKAQARAEMPIRASCFCRQVGHSCCSGQ